MSDDASREDRLLSLFIRAEPMIGQSHEAWATDAIALSKKLDCPLIVTANEVDVPVFNIGDTASEVVARYRFLDKIRTAP